MGECDLRAAAEKKPCTPAMNAGSGLLFSLLRTGEFLNVRISYAAVVVVGG